MGIFLRLTLTVINIVFYFLFVAKCYFLEQKFMIAIKVVNLYEIIMIKLVIIKNVIIEIIQKEWAFLSSINWNATNKNLTEKSIRIKHFFMKKFKEELVITKVTNVSNSNKTKV